MDDSERRDRIEVIAELAYVPSNVPGAGRRDYVVAEGGLVMAGGIPALLGTSSSAAVVVVACAGPLLGAGVPRVALSPHAWPPPS